MNASSFDELKQLAAQGRALRPEQFAGLTPAQAKELDCIYREKGGYILDDSQHARTRALYEQQKEP